MLINVEPYTLACFDNLVKNIAGNVKYLSKVQNTEERNCSNGK